MRHLTSLTAALALTVCAGAAQAQYREAVTSPTTNYWFTPHDAPRTVTGSVGYQGGQSTITFVSMPAPSVRAQAQGGELGYEVAAGQLDYDFYYSGPAMSYVPINYLGLFNLQHGLARFNRSEVGVNLTTRSMDFSRGQAVGMQLTCAQTCEFSSPPTASSLSSMQVPFTTYSAATGFDSSSASGSFSGILMGATDANGNGRGTVSLNAFASVSLARLSWAFIDPMFTIDPAFLAAHPESTLTLPPGVGNTITAVPEPQALALMLAGLGWLALRRRLG